MSEKTYHLIQAARRCERCNDRHRLDVVICSEIGGIRFDDTTYCQRPVSTEWIPVENMMSYYPGLWTKIHALAEGDSLPLVAALDYLILRFSDPGTAEAARREVYEHLSPMDSRSAAMLALTTPGTYRTTIKHQIADWRDPRTGKPYDGLDDAFCAGLAQVMWRGTERRAIMRKLVASIEPAGVVLYEEDFDVEEPVKHPLASFPDTATALTTVRQVCIEQQHENVEDLVFAV